MWIRTTEDQWVNSAHIARVYLHDAHGPSSPFSDAGLGPVVGVTVLADLANGHTVALAYLADADRIDAQRDEFTARFQGALQAGDPVLDLLAHGYARLPVQLA